MRKFPPTRAPATLLFPLLLALAGCGGGGSAGDAASSGPAMRPDSHPRPEDALVISDLHGRYGGRYVSTQRMDPKTWNVLMANEASTTTFTSGPLFEGLVSFNNYTQDREAALADRWESSDDGLVWTFYLRRGLRWSDGEPLTADDVMFTSEVIYDEEIHPSVAELAKVDGKPFRFEKIDDATVQVTIAAPYASFLNVIGSIYIMPRHKLEASYRNRTFPSTYGVDSQPHEIVTSGPWTVHRHVPQEKVILRPNPYYYRFDESGHRLPYLDELVYLIVPDQNAELLNFQSGESDEVYFRAEDYASMKDGEEAGGYTVYDLGQEMGTDFFWFNLNPGKHPETGRPYVDPVKLAWFTKLDFRIAMSHAVDREGIARNIYYGMAEPLFGPIPPANKKWHSDDIERYPYDLDKARAALDRSGFRDTDGDGYREDERGNKLSFVMLTGADNRERLGMCNIIRDDLAKIGVECVVSPVEFNTIISKLRSTFDYEAMLLGLTGGVPPHPSQSSNVFMSSGKTHFWNPEQPFPATPWEAEIDRLMTAQVSIMDEAELAESFAKVQRIISENQPAIYTVSRRGLIAVRNKFTGLRPSVLRPWVLHVSEQISYDPAGAERELAQAER